MSKLTLPLQIIIFIIMLWSPLLLFSQGATCMEASPFCSDVDEAGIKFPNTADGTHAEFGPNYGCLGSVPNPAWYYLQIDSPGDLRLRLSQNEAPDGTGYGLDVDFIVWGPFSDTDFCSPSQLGYQNQIDCSYSADAIETVTIPNTQKGQIYLMLITNYSLAPGFISLEKIGGQGSTDCSILAGNLGPDQFPCRGESILLNGTTRNADSYKWFKDDVLISGENGPTIEVVESGMYTLQVTNSEGNADTDEVQVTFVSPPNVGLANDLIACHANDLTTFDLTDNLDPILQNLNPTEVIVTFHSSQNDADERNNPLPNILSISESLRIYVRVENIVNQNCADTSLNFDLIIGQSPETAAVEPLLYCNANNANEVGQTVFLTDKNHEILNGRENIRITYHQTSEDATNAMNTIELPYSNTFQNETIFYRLEDEASSCFSVSSFELIVAPPVKVQHATLVRCDASDGAIDGLATYNLTEAHSDLMVEGEENDHTFSYFLTRSDAEEISNAQNNIFTSTQPNQMVFVRVQRKGSNCYSIAELTLATAVTTVIGTSLEGCGNDGFYEFDLRHSTAVLTEQNQLSEATITYYTNRTDLLQEENALPALYTSHTVAQETIFARIEVPNSCFGITEVHLNINPMPQIDLQGSFFLCGNQRNGEAVSTQLDTGLVTPTFEFEWFLNGIPLPNETNGTLTAYSEGTYSVRATNLATGCTDSRSVEVLRSSAPNDIEVEITSLAFEAYGRFVVKVNGDGEYEYQLNTRPFQQSPHFDKVKSGTHIISVCDINGCGCSRKEFVIIDYPRFFTPNGDPINNEWNIPPLQDMEQARISIFNRYGKLLAQISPTSEGWDGTYKGKVMPSGDYWFKMEFTEKNKKRLLQGHFALKR